MSQNASAQRSTYTSAVPARWRRLHVRWSPEMIFTQHAVTFTSTNERRWLALRPGDAPGLERIAEDDWTSFDIRSAYPDTAPIALTDAPCLLVVRVFARGDDERAEFRHWLDEEHCRRQVSLPGVHWYLGYEQEGAEHSFLNVWSVEEPSIVDSEAWVRIRETPWWGRLSHVLANADRGVYRPVTSAER